MEQILISLSRKITKAFIGAMKYLWGGPGYSDESRSIHNEVVKRNKFVTEENKAMVMDVLKYRQKVQQKLSAKHSTVLN